LPLFALDLRAAPAGSAVVKWLDAPQKMRSIGAVFSEDAQAGGFVEIIPRSFDVLFFVKQTTTARENPRREQWRLETRE
jgi:erythromycin esterase